MVKKIVFSGKIEYLQILKPDGTAESRPGLSMQQIKEMYEWMVLARIFDDKCLKMQRQGRMGTYASVRGQEATQVGSALALEKADWVFPSFREATVAMIMGVPLENIMLYWAGDERGSKSPEGINYVPVSIPVSTHLPHAVGAAWGMKLLKKRSASMVYFGDGATSKGDFHEALNFAGVFRVPCIFLCQNNNFAISLPREKQTAAKTLAQKALAYGLPGIQIDGNDIFAVYKTAKESLTSARAGKGPTLIECVTYRMENHTTADDAARYRTKEELKLWEARDPIDRLRKYMQKRNLWNKGYEAEVIKKATERVEEAVKKMEDTPLQKPEDIFLYMFENVDHLREQMAELIKEDKDA